MQKQFNISIAIQDTIEGDNVYKLMCIDESGVVRGESTEFTFSEVFRKSSFSSVESFETISDDEGEDSFTVIDNILLDTNSISSNWEMTTYKQKGTDIHQANIEEGTVQSKIVQGIKTDIIAEGNTTSLVKEIEESIETTNECSKTFHPSSVDDSTLERVESVDTNENFDNSSELPVTTTLEPTSEVKEKPIGIETQNEERGDYSSMSQSVILDKHISQSEARSLQTRNRGLVKKVKKLSEMLDEEKKVSSEALEKLLEKTEENVHLVRIINEKEHQLKKSTDSSIADLKKRIERLNMTIAEKDRTISILKERTDTLTKQYHEATKMDRTHRSPHKQKKPSDDTEIKPSSTQDSYHRSRHHEKMKKRYSYGTSRSTPFMGDNLDRTFDRSKPEEELYRCPICNEERPAHETEMQKSIHVDYCLKQKGCQ